MFEQTCQEWLNGDGNRILMAMGSGKRGWGGAGQPYFGGSLTKEEQRWAAPREGSDLQSIS
jgi:hypothetical protein